jgi:hypothetical protein
MWKSQKQIEQEKDEEMKQLKKSLDSSYSEEEVLDILLKFDNFKEVHHAKGKSILDYETRMKWFEQFKK